MVFKVLVAVVVVVVVIRLGLGLLRTLATPLPSPPPPGELRKVKLQYRCSLCGTEVRMTVATDCLLYTSDAADEWNWSSPRSDGPRPRTALHRLWATPWINDMHVIHRPGTGPDISAGGWR